MEKRRKGGAHLASEAGTAGSFRSAEKARNTGRAERAKPRATATGRAAAYEADLRESSARPSAGGGKRPAARKRKGVRRGVIIGICAGGLFLVFISLALIIASKLNKIDYNDGKVTTPVELAAQKETALDVSGLETKTPVQAQTEMKADDDVLNILLLGTDERELEFTDDARADTVMILSLDFKNTTAKLVSIQRGTGMPMLEGQYKDHYDMITCCFAYGGADLLMRQIQQCFRIDVDRYVRVNLNMLIKVIDVLGGVDVELTEK